MIHTRFVLLGEVTPPPSPAPPQLSAEMLCLIGAVSALVLLAVVWALFIRKRKKDLSDWRTPEHEHHRHRRHHHHRSDGSSGDDSGHQRRRRRRRRHRTRNPTLAETGGLPPLRPGSQSESAP